jgi:hypothetical protein
MRHGVSRDGEGVITPLALAMISARARACHAFGEVLSFKQRKKVPKEAP